MYLSVRNRPPAGPGAVADPRVRRVAGTVLLLGLVSLLTDVSTEMVNAVLPLYLTAQVGLGLLAYGFIDGLYQGVSALVRIAGGYLGDRYHHPKWIATIGYGASALSRLAMLPATSFLAITGVISADRLGKGLRTAPRDGLIAEVSHPATLGRAFGMHRMLDTVGAAIGPVVAFALLSWTIGGYDSIWVVSFAVAVIGVAVLMLLVPDRRLSVTGTRPATRELLRAMIGPRLRRPLIAAGLLSVLTIGDGFLYLALQQRDDFAAKWFPMLYLGTNISYLALAVPFGRLADRVGRSKVFLGGHIVLIAVYLTAGAPWVGTTSTVLTLLLLGVFYAATDGVLPALVSRLIPAGARGSGIASAQTVVVLARFASSLAFGGLWTGIGRQSALLGVAGATALAVPLAAWLLRGADRWAAPTTTSGSVE